MPAAESSRPLSPPSVTLARAPRLSTRLLPDAMLAAELHLWSCPDSRRSPAHAQDLDRLPRRVGPRTAAASKMSGSHVTVFKPDPIREPASILVVVGPESASEPSVPIGPAI